MARGFLELWQSYNYYFQGEQMGRQTLHTMSIASPGISYLHNSLNSIDIS